MSEDGRSCSSLSEASDSADSSRNDPWLAAIGSSRKHTEDDVMKHFLPPTTDSQHCGAIPVSISLHPVLFIASCCVLPKPLDAPDVANTVPDRRTQVSPPSPPSSKTVGQ
ncbi:hypothetical protein AVEN_242574-1 [Araneus ventricosus]|uniref:Uncharacterized protein n=1 Tax=Araneus ventricosus TaxID=182803 RepID=A0A4Y2T8R1_ARAVE|nr:hypothetical protein AVEN_242574-1 [Araneus ventricosus]